MLEHYFWWYVGILVLVILFLIYFVRSPIPLQEPFQTEIPQQSTEKSKNTCPKYWEYVVSSSSKVENERVSDLTKELLAFQSRSQFESRFNKAFEANRLRDSDERGYSPHEPVQQTNRGTEPWNHHPIQSLLYDPVLQYPNIYANEMNNITFERTLMKVFSIPKQCPLQQLSPILIPNASTDSAIIKAYDRVLSFIQSKLNSTTAFDLCADTERFKIQVVHDVWTGYQNSLTDDSYKIIMETILYRESKFIGKHVRFQAIVKKKKVSICEALVLGVISEDQIALYPVVASDPADDRLWGKFPSIILEPEPTLLLNSADIKKILGTYKKKQEDEAKAYQAITGSNINDYIVQPSTYVRPAPKYIEELPSFLQPLQDF
jgi:hypothetical protein